MKILIFKKEFILKMLYLSIKKSWLNFQTVKDMTRNKSKIFNVKKHANVDIDNKKKEKKICMLEIKVWMIIMIKIILK